jgi:tetratricopeptide (TPR) repeat protein
MKQTIYILFTLLLISCNSVNEKRITELFKEVNENRIHAKKAAIKACEKIISLDDTNSNAYRILSELTLETGDFERSLEFNKKLTELQPEMYQYQAQTGLLLEVFDRKEESQAYYAKSRALFKQKEAFYWTQADTLSIASMLIRIGDSIRARRLIDSMIKRQPNNPEYIKPLRELQAYSHREIINHLKTVMGKIEYSDPDENKESKIFESEN